MAEARYKTLFLISSFLCGICLIFLYNVYTESQKNSSLYECDCPCHKRHQKEEDEALQRMREERAFLQEEKRKACSKMMEEQTEELLRPLREFREKYLESSN